MSRDTNWSSILPLPDWAEPALKVGDVVECCYYNLGTCTVASYFPGDRNLTVKVEDKHLPREYTVQLTTVKSKFLSTVKARLSALRAKGIHTVEIADLLTVLDTLSPEDLE